VADDGSGRSSALSDPTRAQGETVHGGVGRWPLAGCHPAEIGFRPSMCKSSASWAGRRFQIARKRYLPPPPCKDRIPQYCSGMT